MDDRPPLGGRGADVCLMCCSFSCAPLSLYSDIVSRFQGLGALDFRVRGQNQCQICVSCLSEGATTDAIERWGIFLSEEQGLRFCVSFPAIHAFNLLTWYKIATSIWLNFALRLRNSKELEGRETSNYVIRL